MRLHIFGLGEKNIVFFIEEAYFLKNSIFKVIYVLYTCNAAKHKI